ncbi:hypothetical protein AURDEDRAFT_181527 [Auricularia subglabra TFB-10046 SS5]|nr:hypothetical protein AURDEDRAFT_181527 [Auricularia subglabra TFB-10046 SS5]
MSHRASNVQTLFVSASVLALAVTARPISDPNVLIEMGSQAQQVSHSLLSHLSQFAHPASSSDNTNASNGENETQKPKNEDNTAPSPSKESTSAKVLDRLMQLAGQAPLQLVESWAKNSNSQGAAAVQSHGTGEDEATIFVFTAPETPEPVLVVPPGSGTPMEVVFTDAPAPKALAATANSSTKAKAAAKGQQAFAAVQPLVATTMLALLSLGVILAAVAIYHTLGLATRKARPADLETAAPADLDVKKKPAQIATDDEKAAHELAEKVLSFMPPPRSPRPRSRSPIPPSPRMVPLPHPTADEGALDEKAALLDALSRSPSPYLTPQELDGVPGEYFPDPEELELLIDVAAQTVPHMQLAAMMERPEPVPMLPLQVALLFPYLNDGWVLRFFVVLFGWWTMMLSPRRS